MQQREIKNNNIPLVSINCITYNHESYIRDCLDGFLMQKTNFLFEILIHDDASTDNTAQIIKEYQTKYPDIIKPIFQTENQYSKGVMISPTFNWPRAIGKYIASCEGDDCWIDSDKLQKQIDFLESNKDCSACFTNARYLNELDDTEKFFINGLEQGRVPDGRVIIAGGTLYPTASLVFRTNLINFEMFKIFPNLAGDELLIINLAMYGNIYFINHNTCIYRRWSGGVYSSISKNISKILDRKTAQIYDYKLLADYLDKKFTTHINRKISLISLYILRNDKTIKKYRYLKYLHPKEMAKFFLGSKMNLYLLVND